MVSPWKPRSPATHEIRRFRPLQLRTVTEPCTLPARPTRLVRSGFASCGLCVLPAPKEKPLIGAGGISSYASTNTRRLPTPIRGSVLIVEFVKARLPVAGNSVSVTIILFPTLVVNTYFPPVRGGEAYGVPNLFEGEAENQRVRMCEFFVEAGAFHFGAKFSFF